MRIPLPVLVPALASILTLTTVRTEAAPNAVSPTTAVTPEDGESFLSIDHRAAGQPILVVNYPWQEYAKASIEIRQVAPDEVDNWQIKPLFFSHEFFNGRTSMAISRCLVRAAGTATSDEFTLSKIDFEILADRNSFNSPSVCVGCRTGYKPEGEHKVSRLVFPVLEDWSPDRSKLHLDLPAAYFPNKCTVRVWLLRDHKVVWTATVPWPGDR